MFQTKSKTILVTGGNSGIGLALCRQLAVDHGCRVLMGSRSAERGQKAASSIDIPDGCKGSVEMVHLDVSKDNAVESASVSVKRTLGDEMLYAIVNNAGVGLSSKATPEDVLNTNLYGPKRVCDYMSPLLSPTEGRIVNVGSGAGPKYVSSLPHDAQVFLSQPPESWEQIEAWAKGSYGLGSSADTMDGYGLSKALLASFTMFYANKYQNFKCSCITPGFIDTKLTAGTGASKTPEEGTVSIRHCLFDELPGNGLFYGSDAVRSPLHYVRNPGEPAYDGTPPSKHDTNFQGRLERDNSDPKYLLMPPNNALHFLKNPRGAM